MVSIIIRAGIRRVGVPSGRRCPRAAVGLFRRPIMTVMSHRGAASARFMESWVVGVKVYGRRPSILIEIRNTIRDVRSRAHVWPAMLRGCRSCFVTRLINQAWRAKVRLDIHRVEMFGKRIHGRRIARAISGIPMRVGLKNWSNRLRVMVRLRF